MYLCHDFRLLEATDFQERTSQLKKIFSKEDISLEKKLNIKKNIVHSAVNAHVLHFDSSRKQATVLGQVYLGYW